MKKVDNLRESTVYLRFFSANIWTILAPALLICVIAYLYYQTLPVTFHASTLLEMEYTEENLAQKTILVDEAVSLLRSAPIQQKLELDLNRLIIYKTGPVVISIEAQSPDKRTSEKDVTRIVDYAKENFGMKQQGNVLVNGGKPSPLLYLSAGFVFGAILGIFFSLLKTYLTNY